MRKALQSAIVVVACGLVVRCAPGQTGAAKPALDEKPWAFLSPKRPAVPTVIAKQWVRNPIDAFILAEMEKAGVRPALEADRRTLIRRVSFDLTGLPPTPEEVDAFVRDGSVDAYEKVVDRLLASPQYGERWAMYWLDLVRFAESDGFKADDPRPLAWRYRDYVIDALNRDKPYDRFIQEQIAGDELFPDDPAALVATGFNRHGPTEHNAKNLELHRQEILNDMTDTTGLVFLGLTVGCARCHDHKYDPILQTDYYRLQAFFAAYRAKNDQMVGSAQERADYQQKMQVWQEETAGLQKKMAEMDEPYRKKIINGNKGKYDKFLQESYDLPPAQRTPLQQQLAEMFSLQLQVDRAQMTKSMKAEIKTEYEALTKELAKFDHLKPPRPALAMMLTDIGPQAPPTYLLVRGNYMKKGKEVEPGFLAIFDRAPAKIPPPGPDAKTTGRRSVLAKWLTRSDNPLSTRVMVNRLWQHHFGRGIVGTPSDFGEIGDRPTHPDLLDWLATEFVGQGWSVKKMHRLMVTSATYRQSSLADATALKQDPDNRLFSRMQRRRLEGEAIRDAMLSVSGLLNPKAGGPGVFPELPAELNVPRGGWLVSADPAERNRRSVYVFAKRNLRYPIFGTFDAPEGNESCARRNVSTSAPQALMLLNSKITLDWARSLAGRVLREAGNEHGPVIERIYSMTLGRGPTAKELDLARDFLKGDIEHVRQQIAAKADVPSPVGAPTSTDPALGAALVDLCHVMLNVNEFAYVD
jgi:hypothetical protein